jgi:hypothetical protein
MRKYIVAAAMAVLVLGSAIAGADAMTTAAPAALGKAVQDITTQEQVHCRPGWWHWHPWGWSYGCYGGYGYGYYPSYYGYYGGPPFFFGGFRFYGGHRFNGGYGGHRFYGGHGGGHRRY